MPDHSQQATLRALDDDELEEIVKTYVDAWERNDVDAVVSLLTEDAAIAMPPLASWFGPRDEFAAFLRQLPDVRQIRWKMRITTANGQPAFGAYAWDEASRPTWPFALNVLTLRGNRISDVVAFAVRRSTRRAGATTTAGPTSRRRRRGSEHVRAFRAP